MAHVVLSAEGQRLGHGISQAIWQHNYMVFSLHVEPQYKPQSTKSLLWGPPIKVPQFWETLIYETEICIVRGPPPMQWPSECSKGSLRNRSGKGTLSLPRKAYSLVMGY